MYFKIQCATYLYIKFCKMNTKYFNKILSNTFSTDELTGGKSSRQFSRNFKGICQDSAWKHVSQTMKSLAINT